MRDAGIIRIIKTTAKILAGILLLIVILIVAVYIYLNTASGKKLLKNKAENFLNEKLKTKFTIGSIDFSLPNYFELNQVYLEDQQKDTLLFGEQLAVRIALLKLIDGETDIKKVGLKNVQVNLSRTATDSLFNFQFIVDAFAGKPQPENTNVVKDTAAMKLMLRELDLDRVSFRLHDDYGGSYMAAQIDKLHIGFNRFQSDKLRFGVNTLDASGIAFDMLTTKADTIVETDKSVPDNQLFLTAKKIKLANVNVNIQDSVSGFAYANQINSLELTKALADIKNENIEADVLSINRSTFHINTRPMVATNVKDSSDNKSSAWKITLAKLQLDSNAFTMNTHSGLKKDGFDPQHINIDGLYLHADRTYFTPDSFSTLLSQLRLKDHSGLTIDTLHADIVYAPHHIAANDLYLRTPHSLIKDQLQISFDSLGNLRSKPERASVLVSLKESVIAFNDLFLVLPDLKRSEPLNKFGNQFLKVNALISGTLAQLDIPMLQLFGLQGSYMQAKGRLLHITNIDKLMLDLKMHPVIVAKNDLLKLVSLTPQAAASLPTQINIEADALGSLNDLQTELNVSAGDLLVDAKAILKKINDPDRLQYDALIRNSRVKRSLLLAFLPKEKLPQSLALPDLITLKGKLSGDKNNILSDISLGGSYGLVTVNGYVKNFADADHSAYDLTLHSSDFALGQLIKQDTTIGKVTMQAYLKGQGFDIKHMQTTAEITINSIGFKHYDYQQIKIDATFNNGKVESNGSVNDPNLSLNFKANASLSAEYPSGELWLHLDTARLQALHLLDDTLDIALNTYVKADDLDPAHLNASVRIDSILINARKQRLYLDSINIDALAENGEQLLSLRSPVAEMQAKGRYQINQLIPSLMQYVNHFYPIDVRSQSVSVPQQIAVQGIIREHPLVKQFVKGLTRYDSVTFSGNYASTAGDSALNFNLVIPYVAYTDKKLFQGKVNLQSANDQLNFSAKVDTLYTGSNKMYGSDVSGYIAHDSLHADVLTRDATGKEMYRLGANATAAGETYTFRLKPNLILNYKPWTVDPANEIFYAAQGFYVNKFNLSYLQSGIGIQSEKTEAASPINIDINRFQISDITALLNQDTLLASGVLNAHAKLSDFNKTLPAFEGNVTIDSIRYRQTAVGNVSVKASKIAEDKVSAEATLGGNGNDVNVKGTYFLNQPEQQFEALLGIKQLNMASIEGFLLGKISEAKGSINGDLTLSGKFSDPHWEGTLHLKDPGFRVTQLGTVYQIHNQQIGFEYPYIRFDQFTINDSAKHTLAVNGTVKALSAASFGLDLSVRSNDFILVNSPRASNDLIYGFAAVDANVQIGGTFNTPDIQGTLSLTDETDATLILPEKNIDLEATKSVVRFIDRDTFPLPEQVLFVPENPEDADINTFLNYNLNLQLSPKSALTVVIDPATGDEIRLQGDAKLNIGVDPGGNIILAGNYNLDQGHYILHYQFLERKFNLLSGSTVAFGGGPLEAQMDIKAEYIANTSAIDLVGNELGDADSKTAMTFNQKIPFRVLLFIKGTIKDLKISFDIQMPDENKGLSNTIVTTVENKLSQLRADPASINKQVFSLLVLNRFVGEQSIDFFKGNGDGVSDIARQSVSKFLSAALDQIAADLIRGVDIDLNVNSYKDYSTGAAQQKTDVNIGVSKRFMDDRLTISVGKNLGVEGQDRSAKARQTNTGSYIPDATINYKLSKDGRYMIRAYSKNKFEVIMDGYVVETGLSFVISMDYEKFNELFNRKKRTRKE